MDWAKQGPYKKDKGLYSPTKCLVPETRFVNEKCLFLFDILKSKKDKTI